MLTHVRANLWLLLLTLVLCAGLYPFVLLAIGQVAFRHQAEGSLLRDADGTVVGSRLIAQPFGKDEYFQPRPSAASYNAAASAASNWGASNYLLRDRVARTLGPIVKYRGGPKKDQLVAGDVEKWFVAADSQRRAGNKPGLVAEWADAHGGVAAAWANADDKHKKAIKTWMTVHADVIKAWQEKNEGEPKEADRAVDYFKDYSATAPGQWPKLIDDASWSVSAVFFDMWRQEHADAELEEVPADMVMASGSGLDPHITLKNAMYQLDRVAAAWAGITKRDQATIRREIEALLQEKFEAPLGGLAGEKLVNVLEINLALRKRYGA